MAKKPPRQRNKAFILTLTREGYSLRRVDKSEASRVPGFVGFVSRTIARHIKAYGAAPLMFCQEITWDSRNPATYIRVEC